MSGRWVTTEAGAFVVPECPSWCARPEGHDLNRMEEFDGAVMRVHESEGVRIGETGGRDVDAITVGISAPETVGRPDEPLDDDPPMIDVGDHTFTAAQARQYAAVLLNAADMLDQINGATR